jgi:hypothetical protein
VSADEVLAREYGADGGRCHYCDGRHRYASPARWWRHLRTQHPDTYRTTGVAEALEVPR